MRNLSFVLAALLLGMATTTLPARAFALDCDDPCECDLQEGNCETHACRLLLVSSSTTRHDAIFACYVNGEPQSGVGGTGYMFTEDCVYGVQQCTVTIGKPDPQVFDECVKGFVEPEEECEGEWHITFPNPGPYCTIRGC